MRLEDKKELLAQLEAILFASGDPIGVERLCLGLDLTRSEVDSLMDELIARYEFAQGGLRIVRMNASYQMCSAPEFAAVVRDILETRAPPKLSQPALEVLAIIAYHQPSTRAYVDQVRGVDSTYTVGVLMERGLLEECGKLKEMPGRPTLYRTTEVFLRSFHMETLSDLPDLGQPEPVPEQLSIQQRLDELQEPEKMELPEAEPEQLSIQQRLDELQEAEAESEQKVDQPEPEADQTEPESEETEPEADQPEPESEETETEADQSELEETDRTERDF